MFLWMYAIYWITGINKYLNCKLSIADASANPLILDLAVPSYRRFQAVSDAKTWPRPLGKLVASRFSVLGMYGSDGYMAL